VPSETVLTGEWRSVFERERMAMRVANVDQPATALTLRERGKQERRIRILRATRAVLEKSGYEGTTMRAIARRAKVGIGTLFRHGEGKDNLILEVLGDDLDAIAQESIERLNADGDLLTEIVELFRARFTYWAACPQPKFYSEIEVQTERYSKRHAMLISKLVELVKRQQEMSRVRDDRDPLAAARLIMVIYLGEARMWLRSGNLDVEKGVAQFSASLKLAIDGLTSAPAARRGLSSQRRRSPEPVSRTS
jgi:AcrR family transcriptional regulator